MCTENSDSDVLMMQSADHGVRRDTSDLLNRSATGTTPEPAPSGAPCPNHPFGVLREEGTQKKAPPERGLNCLKSHLHPRLATLHLGLHSE